MRPHSVERLGHNPRVAQCLVKQFRAPAQNQLRHFDCLGGMAFLDMLREALLEIRFVPEMREMNRHGVGRAPASSRPTASRPRTTLPKNANRAWAPTAQNRP